VRSPGEARNPSVHSDLKGAWSWEAQLVARCRRSVHEFTAMAEWWGLVVGPTTSRTSSRCVAGITMSGSAGDEGDSSV